MFESDIEVLNFEIDRGTSFSTILTYRDNAGRPVNLTGYSAAMYIRLGEDSSSLLLKALDTGGFGGILIPSPNPREFIVTISKLVTATFSWTQGYYDFIVTDAGGISTKILKGCINVNPSVSA